MDTNVILEAHRTSSWRPLRGGYPLETVEDCVVETQTGAQNRRPEQTIQEATLRADLAAIHVVTVKEQAALLARNSFAASLDAGERMLWAHALARPDTWLLCSPDTASIRLGIKLGLHDRLAVLETLLTTVGHHSRVALRRNYTAAWHRECVARIAVEEGIGPA